MIRKLHYYSTLAAALAVSITGFSAQAQEIQSTNVNPQDDPNPIEEVIVTGSYIRSSPLDAPSPVQVIDRSSIEAQGAAQVWDVIKNLEINSGSTTNTGSVNEGSGIEGTANINLRNLGQNATLTLLNGKRQVAAATVTRDGSEFVDLNSIPTTMVDRIEVLQDGGSAIYGSDAIAGVVNIIMRTDFEGFELYGDVQNEWDAGSVFDSTISAVWGWASGSGDTHFVIAGEYFDRDGVNVSEAAFFDENSEVTGTLSADSQFTPIFGGLLGDGFNRDWINQPLTDENNANRAAAGLTPSTRYTDPLCGNRTALGFDSFTRTRTDQPTNINSACREDTTRFNNVVNPEKRQSATISFNHDINDSTELYSFFQYSRNKIKLNDDGSARSLGPQTILPALGDVGFVADLFYSLGSQAAFAGNTPPTITNAPNSLSNGGPNAVAFIGTPIELPRDGGNDQRSESKTAAAQIGIRGDFNLFDKNFNYDVGYSHSVSSFERHERTVQRTRMELAVNGLGGPNCTPNGRTDFDLSRDPVWSQLGVPAFQEFFPGYFLNTRETISLALTSNNQGDASQGCFFFNPYLTRLTNPNLANSQELIDWLTPVVNVVDGRNHLGVFEAVVSGELFDMPSGPAQFALGFQFRDQRNRSIASDINDPGLTIIAGTDERGNLQGYDENGVPNQFAYASDNLRCSFCILTYNETRNIRALFSEFSVPLADSIESQLALRYEDYGGVIGSELSPKLALSWRPLDSLLLRTSYSQSFRAPNVAIVKQGFAASDNRGQDILSAQEVRAGILPPTLENAELEQVFTLGEPSPNLQNEKATTYNLGFQWTPNSELLDGFRFGMDYWRFEIDDKVVSESVNGALQDELALFRQAAADPNNYVINSTLEPGETVTPCDPNNLPQVEDPDNPGSTITLPRVECVVDPIAYRIVGVQRALDSDGNLITAVLGAVNAGEITTDGIDLKTGYTWDSDWGNFSIGLDYTWVNQYTLKDVPGLENGLQATGLLDAAGTTGDGVVVRSLPDHKGKVIFGWNNDRHSFNAISRYIGSYDDLLADGIRRDSIPEVAALARDKIDSYNAWDFQYNYVADVLNDYSAIVTLGVLDAFEADIPYRETAGGFNYDTTVFDPRGRRVYLRALFQFQ